MEEVLIEEEEEEEAFSNDEIVELTGLPDHPKTDDKDEAKQGKKEDAKKVEASRIDNEEKKTKQEEADRSEALRIAKEKQAEEERKEAQKREALRIAEEKEAEEKRQEAQRREALRIAEEKKAEEKRQEAQRREALRIAEEKEAEEKRQEEEALRIAKEKEAEEKRQEEEALRIAKKAEAEEEKQKEKKKNAEVSLLEKGKKDKDGDLIGEDMVLATTLTFQLEEALAKMPKTKENNQFKIEVGKFLTEKIAAATSEVPRVNTPAEVEELEAASSGEEGNRPSMKGTFKDSLLPASTLIFLFY